MRDRARSRAEFAAARRDMIKYYRTAQDKQFKGDVRRQAFIAVAFFYTARAEFSIDRICVKLDVTKEDFNGAMHDLTPVLMLSVEYQALLQIPRSDPIPMLTRMIDDCMPAEHKSAIRLTAIRIYDIIRGDESLRTCLDEKLNATVIYMACTIKKLGITDEDVCAWYGIKNTTLHNIEACICDILQSKPPAKRVREAAPQVPAQPAEAQATPARFQSALVRYGSAGGLSDDVCLARAAARRSMRHGQIPKLSRSATM